MSPAINHWLGFDPLSLDAFAELWENLSRDGQLWVASDDDGVCGTYWLRRFGHRRAHAVYLGYLAVDPKRQRSGIGRAILSHVVDQVAKEGCRRLEAMVAADNEPALSLFQALGFSVEGRFAGYFRRAGADQDVDELPLALALPTSDLTASATVRGGIGLVNRTNATHYTWGNGCDGWHLVRNRELSVIAEQMPPGTSEQRHRHARSRQFFYVLEGTLAIEVEGTSHRIPAAAGLEVPPGAVHQVFNDSTAPAQFLVTSQPPGRHDRIVEDGQTKQPDPVAVNATAANDLNR